MANPFLSELTKVTTETSCLTEPDQDEMVYVARFVSAHFVPVHMPIGSRIPMYCTASGRAYLAALPVPEAQAIVEKSHRVAHTMHTRTEVADIMETLRETRQRGYAINREELFLGDMTIAAPIVSGNGRALGAIHLVAPTGRWTPEEMENKLGPALLQSARAICTSVRALG